MNRYISNRSNEKICQNCGFENIEFANYCEGCGRKLDLPFGKPKPNIPLMEMKKDLLGLVRLLSDEDVYIRRRAIKALARLKDKKAMPPLRKASRDSDPLVKKYAKIALKEIKDSNSEMVNKKDIIEISLKCPNCGFENLENAKFCSGCANILGSNNINNNSTIIEINSASEDKIASLPGIGPILAKKAILIKESKGGFDSVEDFCTSLELKPHIAKSIESIITCKKPIEKDKKSKENRLSGRIIDF